MKRNVFIKLSLVLTLVLSLVVLTSCKKKFTVTFDSDGGTQVVAVEVKKGKKVEKPANPTKEGYTFIEWTLDGSTYNFETEVTENITLVAKWKKNTPQEIVKVDAPENVAMSETEITWSPVANATGYIVYVNGNAKEVTKTSISLSEVQSYFNNVEDVFCVVAKQGNSESAASAPVIKKGNVSNTEVEDVKMQMPSITLPNGTTYQFTDEVVKEVVRTLKKYNITMEEIVQVLNEMNTNTPEITIKKFTQLLNNHSKLAGLLEALVTMGLSYVDAIYDYYFTNLQYPALTQTEKNVIANFYQKICMEIKPEYENTALYNQVLLPWLSAILGAEKLFENGSTTTSMTLMSSTYIGTLIWGWYCTKTNFSATRNATIIEITANGQTFETNAKEFYANMMACFSALTNMTLEENLAFERYFVNTLGLEAIKELKAKKPDFTDMTEKMKVGINVYLPVFVEGMNNLLAMSETLQSLDVALNEIATQIQNIQSPEQIKAIILSMNGFKNQAIDALVATLPTEKQWNAIMYMMNTLLVANEEGKALLKHLDYNSIILLKELLISLKELDLTKYDIMPIFAAMTNPTEEAVAAAKQVVEQMLTDMMAMLPETKPAPQLTVDEIANQIMSELENTEKTNFPVLTIMEVIFGKEIKVDNIKNIINFVNEFVEYAINYNFDKDTLMAIVQNAIANGGSLSKYDSQTLVLMLIDFAKGYVTKDVINEVSPTILEVASLLDEQSLAITKAYIKVFTENFDAAKEFSILSMKAICILTVDELDDFLDKYLAYIEVQENYDAFFKLNNEINKELANDDIIPTQVEMIHTIKELQKLVGVQKYELTADQKTMIYSTYRNLGIDIHWAYPEVDCFSVEYDATSGNYLITLDTSLLDGEISSYYITFEGPGYTSVPSNFMEPVTSFAINPYMYTSFFDGMVQKVVLRVCVKVKVGDCQNFDYVDLDITDCFSEMLMLK